jgi:hypothetical protein
MSGARLVFTRSAVGFMSAKSAAVTIPRVALYRRKCSEITSHSLKKSPLLRAAAYPSARDRAADSAVTVDAERLSAQRVAHSNLPLPGLERGHLLRDLPHRREDQAPGQLRRRVAGRACVLARRDNHPAFRASVDVNVGINATLADELQFVQAAEQRSLDLRSFSDEHQHFCIFQPLSQLIRFLHMIVPDLDVMILQFLEAGQRPDRIEVIVEDCDFHFFLTAA